MYLIFDCSATEKPKNWKAPFSDTMSWPRMVHLSWIILDKDLKPMEDHDFIVTPEGFTIDETIASHCQIEVDRVEKKGKPLDEVLTAFDESLKKAYYVFAHNLNFNENVVAAEYVRRSIDHSLFRKLRFCIMQESTHFCKLPSKSGGYKWPTLSELHAIIFNKAFSPPNNARADVIAATRCFKALMMGKQLDDLFDED